VVNSAELQPAGLKAEHLEPSNDSDDSNMNYSPSIVTSPFRPFDSDDKVQYWDETKGGSEPLYDNRACRGI
jgi:hypothetical protein